MILAATQDASRLFLELGTVTIVLAVGARLAARTGFSSIPLYLVAGIVLGALAPPTLDDALVTTLSEVGIVLLLFTLGLEYSALELASGLRSGVRRGILDLALNFPPGFAIGLLMGWGLVGALVLGGITYVSSSGIVAKVISDLGRVAKPETPGLLSLLILEDLAMALYLPLIGVVLIGSGVSTRLCVHCSSTDAHNPREVAAERADADECCEKRLTSSCTERRRGTSRSSSAREAARAPGKAAAS